MDPSEESILVKDILKSPLGLASKIITSLFEEKLTKWKDDLDEIKLFAAGIQRAEELSVFYSLASYYPSMFAFHQYFHSSFRARQGKVLEQILQYILQQYGGCDSVPEKNADRLSLSGQSNIKLLNEKYDKIGINFNYTSYQDLTDSIDSIVQKIIPLWTEDSIPVKTPADQAQYIRDLLFLKACYEKP